MNKDKSVRIVKLGAASNPDFPTPDQEQYQPGVVNPGVSVPVAYMVEGELLADIKVGFPITMFRRIRNGVVTPGHFETSRVDSMVYLGRIATIRTANSVYEVTEISPPA